MALSLSGKVMVASIALIVLLVLWEVLFAVRFDKMWSNATLFTDERMMSILGKNPFCLWFAIFLVMLNHFLYLVHLQPFELSGVVASSVIILHVWYDPSFLEFTKPKSEPMTISCILIFVNRCILLGAAEELRIHFEKEMKKCKKVILDGMEALASCMVEFWRRCFKRIKCLNDNCLPCLKSNSLLHINTYTHAILAEPLVGESEKTAEERKMMAENVYQDFREPFSKCVLTFLIQAGLTLYYLFSMCGIQSKLSDSDPTDDDDDDIYTLMTDPDNVSIVKWMLAVAITMIVKSDEIGRSFGNGSWRFWEETNNRYELKIGEHEQQHREERNLLPLCWHLSMRAFMDWWINGAMFAILITTSPIMLAVEEPLDFVKDVTALLFILKLDDIEEPVEITDVNTWRKLPKKDAAFTWFTLRQRIHPHHRVPVPQQNMSVQP